jgi:hypothetical protein
MINKYAVYWVVSVGVAVLLSQPSTAWAQAVPNLVIAMSHTGNFTSGVNGVYTIVVSNIGGTATSGYPTVEDLLNPNAGENGVGVDFGFVSATGTGWSCYPQYGIPADWIDLYCQTASPIAPGGSASPITLTVFPTHSGTVTNTANVGYPCVGNICTNYHFTSDPTIVLAAVPTLPEWAMIVVTGLLALVGATALRRRTA